MPNSPDQNNSQGRDGAGVPSVSQTVSTMLANITANTSLAHGSTRPSSTEVTRAKVRSELIVRASQVPIINSVLKGTHVQPSDEDPSTYVLNPWYAAGGQDCQIPYLDLYVSLAQTGDRAHLASLFPGELGAMFVPDDSIPIGLVTKTVETDTEQEMNHLRVNLLNAQIKRYNNMYSMLLESEHIPAMFKGPMRTERQMVNMGHRILTQPYGLQGYWVPASWTATLPCLMPSSASGLDPQALKLALVHRGDVLMDSGEVTLAADETMATANLPQEVIEGAPQFSHSMTVHGAFKVMASSFEEAMKIASILVSLSPNVSDAISELRMDSFSNITRQEVSTLSLLDGPGDEDADGDDDDGEGRHWDRPNP